MRHTLTNKDIDTLTGLCGICGPVSLVWHKDTYRCAVKRKAEGIRKKTPDQRRKETYGLTTEQYTGMVEQQEGKCASCKEERVLVVDHNHDTGEVRVLLCFGCNTLEGLIKSRRPDLLDGFWTGVLSSTDKLA